MHVFDLKDVKGLTNPLNIVHIYMNLSINVYMLNNVTKLKQVLRKNITYFM